MDIATLQKEAHAIASEQGWWDETTTCGGPHREDPWCLERGWKSVSGTGLER